MKPSRKKGACDVMCPGCGRCQPRRGGDSLYWCKICQCQFDDDPDEGGDYFTDPTRRAMKSEEHKPRKGQFDHGKRNPR